MQKIDSISSEDPYNIYESYYKRIPGSQEAPRVLNSTQIIDAKVQNEDLKSVIEESPLKQLKPSETQEIISSPQISYKINENYTEAILNDFGEDQINVLMNVEMSM